MIIHLLLNNYNFVLAPKSYILRQHKTSKMHKLDKMDTGEQFLSILAYIEISFTNSLYIYIYIYIYIFIYIYLVQWCMKPRSSTPHSQELSNNPYPVVRVHIFSPPINI